MEVQRRELRKNARIRIKTHNSNFWTILYMIYSATYRLKIHQAYILSTFDTPHYLFWGRSLPRSHHVRHIYFTLFPWQYYNVSFFMVKFLLNIVSFPCVSSLSRIVGPWVLAALAVLNSSVYLPSLLATILCQDLQTLSIGKCTRSKQCQKLCTQPSPINLGCYSSFLLPFILSTCLIVLS